ncbi:bacterial transcriptional activator domain-containing protein [Streptomyces sp. NPDC020379]|uniref:bacterial transcriptional activator domain-containing protein n=1 Tax=Streptomyces sp. NPDC020379 TaxID=3365071 RepID=UPI0037944AF8
MRAPARTTLAIIRFFLTCSPGQLCQTTTACWPTVHTPWKTAAPLPSADAPERSHGSRSWTKNVPGLSPFRPRNCRTLATPRGRQAADTASFLTSWDPLDEPSHELLVRSLIGMGAPGRAAESLRALDKRLRRELDVEADPQLFALLRQRS